ncbi:uncharacterized protein LOC124535055 isoform X1 [Vanessa cardui]|uniref:uncharacterized protein LOC124535055 isoform X1 n=2 Tax=Vanessa cardui TaxID=171605 RepID=UPI001F14907E|nr:uncharacterized protein LOC124535055 isoform X1 [Vanessa cardui]XP_046967039.1 uncharacterized protein LOC124535055 isoform X1 [Vanessa cardui]
MVFSQTSVNTQRHLKVVEINRLKSEKNQQVNGPTGVITGGTTKSTSSSPVPTTSFSEDYLKPEPIFENTMFHDSDCEFFQDLVEWCATPVAEEEKIQSTDSPNKPETRAHKTDTPYTPISPQGWDVFDANSPSAQTINQTPSYPVSPNVDGLAEFNTDFFYNSSIANNNKVPFQEQFVDINTLPVVIGDLASEVIADMNPWQATESAWQDIHDIDYTKSISDTHNTMPFIHQDDSLDMKFVSVTPREVENNNIIISEYIINKERDVGTHEQALLARPERRGVRLSVDVAAHTKTWPEDVDIISTPEVLSFVEQLEKEKCILPSSTTALTSENEIYAERAKTEESPAPVDYEPITPKSEPIVDSEEDTTSNPKKRRRHDSEDSDETYTPYTEQSPRKYRKRKPNIPIKEMIKALEGAQQPTKTRRGRPPKRRESTLSTVSDNSSVSTHEMKYRELRDKNNEASKRSRMNRKIKELQMEQLADELEERNKILKVRADLLEDMTKKLRDALMTAVSQKKVG